MFDVGIRYYRWPHDERRDLIIDLVDEGCSGQRSVGDQGDGRPRCYGDQFNEEVLRIRHMGSRSPRSQTLNLGSELK